MRKTPLFLMCGAVLMLGVAGCNREALDTDVAKTPADTTPVATTPAPTPAPTPATPAPAGTLTLATGVPGSYVADNTGRAVYVLVGDENGSKCTGACLAAWPPLLADAPVAGSPSLQGVMIGTVERSDGTTQVTYNGHPLYLYAKDTAPGTTMGQDVTDQWGEWYLVGPTGVAIKDDDSSAGVTAEVPRDMDPVDPVKDPVKTDAPPPTY
jgi:predicted lipoprotein with Yx(FWY)xxD motif